jgi:hypothetical protein
MGVTCLLLLSNNGRLLCLSGATISINPSVHCSGHTLLNVTLDVLLSERMLYKDYNDKGSIEKKKHLLMSLKRLDAKTK